MSNTSTTNYIESEWKTSYEENSITLVKDKFGVYKNLKTGLDEIIWSYTWKTTNFMTVQIITYGAIITSIRIPDRYGEATDIVMGFDTIDQYLKYSNYNFGTTIGRVTNIIENSKFCLKNIIYDLSANYNNLHHMNGGNNGFSSVNWIPYVKNGIDLILTHTSFDETEGYPGSVHTQIHYKIRNNNTINILYTAKSTKCTPINLSNRLYFNLAGHNAGHKTIYRHILNINACKLIETKIIDKDNKIPTGKLINVGETMYDFRIPILLGSTLCQLPNQEIHQFYEIMKSINTVKCSNNSISSDKNVDEYTNNNNMEFVSRIIHFDSGRVLELYTNQCCVEFSTCNHLPDPDNSIRPRYNISKLFINNNQIKEDNDLITLNEQKNIDVITCPEQDNENDNTEIDKKIEPIIILPISGKNGASYLKNGAIYMQTQNIPNAVHKQKKYPDIILKPNQEYKHEINYKFGLYYD